MVADSYNLILDSNLYKEGYYTKEILGDNYNEF